MHCLFRQAYSVDGGIGAVMRRVGYEGWLRNLAIALGNSEKSNDLMLALIKRKNHPSSMVREHVEWALEQHN